MTRIPLLPTLLTLGNGVCGFAAIAYASKITPETPTGLVDTYLLLSAGLIFLGMVFDIFDGYAARLFRVAGEFGGQLDSLCDAVTFGAAPAFLLLRIGQEWQGKSIMAQGIAVIAAVYLACAILRLARFNVENTPDSSSHKKFKGLPSPAAAGCVASLAVLRSSLAQDWSGIDQALLHNFVTVFAPIGTLAAALLMVSGFSYPHFGRMLLRGRRQFGAVVQVVLCIAIVALVPHLAFFLFFWAFALSGPLKALTAPWRRGELPEQTAAE